MKPEDTCRTSSVVALVALAGLAVAGCSDGQSEETNIEMVYGDFYDDSNRYHAVIQESEKHFNARNLEGALAGLDDDFTMYRVAEDGPMEMVRGIEATRKAIAPFMAEGALESSWTGSKVYKWGLSDNILVQVEEDTYVTDGEPNTIRTLVVFEHRDGKRWREWRFELNDT